MCKVKAIRSQGVPLAMAVRSALPCSISELARRHGLIPSTFSGLLNGSTAYPYRNYRQVLAEALDVSPEWLDAELDAVRQQRLQASA
jgi:transcriptional regulator with XRE-family HTH domain